MKIVKTRLRNRIDDDFLANYLIVYIVKEIAKKLLKQEIVKTRLLSLCVID
jgi:hypothetical protein